MVWSIMRKQCLDKVISHDIDLAQHWRVHKVRNVFHVPNECMRPLLGMCGVESDVPYWEIF